LGVAAGAGLASNAAVLSTIANKVGTVGRAIGDRVVGNTIQPVINVTKPVGKFVWNIASHPVENFIAPQLASKIADKGLQYTNEKGWTDLDEKERELLSTAVGFGAG
jgi:hypothetical protein